MGRLALVACVLASAMNGSGAWGEPADGSKGLKLPALPGGQADRTLSLSERAARAVKVELVSNVAQLTPGGTSWIALDFVIAPEWHLYWQNPGDSGAPISWTFALPEGLSVGEPMWPVPARKVSPGDILDYIYEERVTLAFPVEAASTLKPGERVSISADVQWLVCSEGCVPGEARVELSLPVASAGAPVAQPSSSRGVFERAKARWARPAASSPGAISASWQGLRLEVLAPGAESMTFFPYGDDHALPLDMIDRGVAQGQRLDLSYPATAVKTDRVRGVVEVRRAGLPPVFFDLEVPPPGPEGITRE